MVNAMFYVPVDIHVFRKRHRKKRAEKPSGCQFLMYKANTLCTSSVINSLFLWIGCHKLPTMF